MSHAIWPALLKPPIYGRGWSTPRGRWTDMGFVYDNYRGPPVVCRSCSGTGYWWHVEFQQAFRCCMPCPPVLYGEDYAAKCSELGREAKLADFTPGEIWPERHEFVVDLLAHGIPEAA